MARLETSDETLDRMIWPCDCDCCYLRLTWEHEDPTFRYLWIDTHHNPGRLHKRIAAAWRALRGKEIGHHEVVLNEQTTDAITNFLNGRRP